MHFELLFADRSHVAEVAVWWPISQKVYDFIIEISQKFCLLLILIAMFQSGYNFAHVMTCAKLWPDWIIFKAKATFIFFTKLG